MEAPAVDDIQPDEVIYMPRRKLSFQLTHVGDALNTLYETRNKRKTRSASTSEGEGNCETLSVTAAGGGPGINGKRERRSMTISEGVSGTYSKRQKNSDTELNTLTYPNPDVQLSDCETETDDNDVFNTEKRRTFIFAGLLRALAWPLLYLLEILYIIE